jgi:predicted dehydrogenase
MESIVNWGVLGAANIAVKHALPGMREAPSAKLLAIASRDLGKAQAVAQALGVPRAYGSYDALLADGEIDAVYVPLPNPLHFEWSLRALEAGKDVLCEKPLCLSSEQISELCAARDRSGRKIEEAFAYRNHPQWTKVLEIIASGTLGAVRSVHGTLAKQFLDPTDIRNNPNDGGGGIYDLGSYAISACNMIFGRKPARVVAALERDPAFGIDRLSSALLDYGDAHAAFTVATQAGSSAWGSHQQLSILCAQGWLRLEFPYSQVRPTECRVEIGDATSVGAFPTSTLSFAAINQFALQAERFSRLVRGEAVRAWPIEEARDTLRTIEGLFESARTGAWQSLT